MNTTITAFPGETPVDIAFNHHMTRVQFTFRLDERDMSIKLTSVEAQRRKKQKGKFFLSDGCWNIYDKRETRGIFKDKHPLAYYDDDVVKDVSKRAIASFAAMLHFVEE
jgi:hypothetical protein